MKMKHKINAILIALLLGMTTGFPASAQVEMADQMRSNGKIYVVVGVLLLIFFGLIGYLVALDRKVSKLEKK